MAGKEHLNPDEEEALDPEERALFRESVGDVRPLASDRAVPEAPGPEPVARQRRRETEQDRLDLATGAADPEPAETGEEVFWCRPGLQHRVRRQLRSGRLPVDAVVDLHGLRVEEARQSLGTFLHRALGHGHRCVRVIHGKGRGSPLGYGVLRSKVQGWLAQREEVLAFASCIPSDGGTGALYVLLRRRPRRGPNA